MFLQPATCHFSPDFRSPFPPVTRKSWTISLLGFGGGTTWEMGQYCNFDRHFYVIVCTKSNCQHLKSETWYLLFWNQKWICAMLFCFIIVMHAWLTDRSPSSRAVWSPTASRGSLRPRFRLAESSEQRCCRRNHLEAAEPSRALVCGGGGKMPTHTHRALRQRIVEEYTRYSRD